MIFAINFEIINRKTEKIDSNIKVLERDTQNLNKISESEDNELKKFKDSQIEAILTPFIMQYLKSLKKPAAGYHFLATFLQLIYLVIEKEEILKSLKKNGMINIIAQLLERITHPIKGGIETNFIEEKLILHLLLKILYKDNSLIVVIVESCINHIKDIYIGKKIYLRSIIDDIITLIAKDPEYGRQAFEIFNKERELVSVSTIHDCLPDRTIAKFWKLSSQGWNSYKFGNLLDKILKCSKDTSFQGPIISEYSIVSLPDLNGEEEKITVMSDQYIAKIRQEYSESD